MVGQLFTIILMLRHKLKHKIGFRVILNANSKFIVRLSESKQIYFAAVLTVDKF